MSEPGEYSEFPGNVIIPSREVTFDREGQPTGHVTLKVPKEDAFDIAKGMTSGFGEPWPGYPAMKCRTATVRDVGCDCAEVDCSYDCFDFPITENVEIENSIQTLPRYLFRFKVNDRLLPVPEGAEPGFQIRRLQISRTFETQTVPSWVHSGVGCVNSGPVNTFTVPCPKETLLYKGASMQRTITRGATLRWSITCHYSYQPQGWNKYYLPMTGFTKFYIITPNVGRDKKIKGSFKEYKMFPEADLSAGFSGSFANYNIPNLANPVH